MQAVKPIEAMEASSVPKPAGPPPTAAQRAAANAEAKAAAAAAVQDAEDARREEARFHAAQRLMKRRTSLRMSMVAMGSPGGKASSSSSLVASAPDVIAEESEVDEGSESEEERAATPLPAATGPPPTPPSSPQPAPNEAPEHHDTDGLSPLVPAGARAGSPARRRQSVVHQGAGSRVAAYIQHYNMRSVGSTGEKVPRRATISRDALASSGDFSLSLPPDMPSLEEFRLQRVATLSTSNFSTASMEPEDWPIAVAPEQLALYSRQVTLQLSPSKAVEEIPSTASPQRPPSPAAVPPEAEEEHEVAEEGVAEEEVPEEEVEELPEEPAYELPPPPVVVPKRTSDERAAMMREWYEQRHRPLHATLQSISDNKPLAQPLPPPEPSAPPPRRAVRYMELEPVHDTAVHDTAAPAADDGAVQVDEAAPTVRTPVAEPSTTLDEAQDGSIIEPSETLYKEYQNDDEAPVRVEDEASELQEVEADVLQQHPAGGNCDELEHDYHEQSHTEHHEAVPGGWDSDDELDADEQRAADDHMAWIESALRGASPPDQACAQDSVAHADHMLRASSEFEAPATAAQMETQLDAEQPEANMAPAQQPELLPAPQVAPDLQPVAAEIEYVICWPSSLPAAAESASGSAAPPAPPAQVRRRHRASLFEPGSGAQQSSRVMCQPAAAAAAGQPWHRVVVLPDLARQREAQWPSSPIAQPAAASAAAAVHSSASQESTHVGYLQRFDLEADTAYNEQAGVLVPDVHSSAHLAPTPHRRSPPLQTHSAVISAVQPAAVAEVPARRAAAWPTTNQPEPQQQRQQRPSQPADDYATPRTEAEGTRLGTATMRRLSGAHGLLAESKDSARAAFEPTTARSGSSRRSCHTGMGSDPLGMSAVQARADQHTQHVSEAARNAPAGPRAAFSAFTPRALPSVRSPRARQHAPLSAEDIAASQASPAPPSGSIAASGAGPAANSGHMAAIAVANLHRAVALLGASKSTCQAPDSPIQSTVARGIAPQEAQLAAPPAASHHWPAERFERLPASAWSSHKLAASHAQQRSPVFQSSAAPAASAVDLDAARTARIAAVAQHLAARTK